MSFPSTLPSYAAIVTPITLQALQHTTRHSTEEADIVAIGTKVGVDGSAVTSTHDYKLSTVAGSNKAETQANKDTDTTLAANSDTKYPSQKAIKAYVDAAITAAKVALYPVGSIYTNASDNTNPSSLLGFGNWTAFGAGRVMVGIDGAQTEFDVIGETGGEKTHTLTIAEMPAHTHPQNVSALTGGTASRNDYDTDSDGRSFAQGITTDATGGGGAHNNLQPYIVVYAWKRTA